MYKKTAVFLVAAALAGAVAAPARADCTGTGFDPEAAYFRPIMIFNYQNPATASTVVQGISVFPVP